MWRAELCVLCLFKNIALRVAYMAKPLQYCKVKKLKIKKQWIKKEKEKRKNIN